MVSRDGRIEAESTESTVVQRRWRCQPRRKIAAGDMGAVGRLKVLLLLGPSLSNGLPCEREGS